MHPLLLSEEGNKRGGVNTASKIVLGIDPGYARMGWAVIEVDERGGSALIACGCIETEKDEPHERRLAQIASEIRVLFEVHCPSKLIIEKLLFTKNQTTGLAVAEARGVVLAVAGALGCVVEEVGPKQVKLAVTGYGNADKQQVQEMVKRLLNLSAVPQPDDAADACAVAMAGGGC